MRRISNDTHAVWATADAHRVVPGRLRRMRRWLDPARARRHLPAAALLLLYLYLGFHAFSGSQGVTRWMEHVDRAEVLAAELDVLSVRRAALQSEVDRLSSRGMDLDTLDVEARRVLFVSAPGELTIWLDPE